MWKEGYKSYIGLDSLRAELVLPSFYTTDRDWEIMLMLGAALKRLLTYNVLQLGKKITKKMQQAMICFYDITVVWSGVLVINQTSFYMERFLYPV